MQPSAKQGVAVIEFVGLVTNTGAIATDAAAQSAAAQVNLVGNTPGEVGSRPGLRRVVFDEDLED